MDKMTSLDDQHTNSILGKLESIHPTPDFTDRVVSKLESKQNGKALPLPNIRFVAGFMLFLMLGIIVIFTFLSEPTISVEGLNSMNDLLLKGLWSKEFGYTSVAILALASLTILERSVESRLK